MKRFILVLALLSSVNVFASKPVKVACIGDGITMGAALENPEEESYPAVLQRMLGSDYDVRNFGANASVMAQTGDHPYMKESRYDSVKTFLPDIVIIMLGTNDSKPHNWNAKQFEADYDTMVREMKDLPSHPDIYACLPPPPSETRWGINDSTIVAGVIPAIRRVSDRRWLEIIDMHEALSGKPDCFADKIHPNPEGAAVIAETVYATLKDNGWTGKPGHRVMFVGDSITDMGWGAANAMPASQRNHYDMNHIYGHGYVEFCAAYYQSKFPEAGYRFYNRGVSGDRLAGISARLEEDVLAVRPDIVSFFVGVNDSFDQTPESFDFTGWERMYRDVIKRTKASNPDCRIVLCTPFIEKCGRVGRSDNFDERKAVVDRLAEIVRAIAKEYGLTCVDFASLIDGLVAKDKSGDRNFWVWDGVHPSIPAHRKMADLWIKSVGKRNI